LGAATKGGDDSPKDGNDDEEGTILGLHTYMGQCLLTTTSLLTPPAPCRPR
jgi:hypothetical protein